MFLFGVQFYKNLQKWGEKLLVSLFVIVCISDCCVVFHVDGYAPCTPFLLSELRFGGFIRF